MKTLFDSIRIIEPKKTPRFIKDLGLLSESVVYLSKYKVAVKKLKIIAVTGTDGKTTTANMIYEMLKSGGIKAGLISTISAKIDNEELDTGFHVTTPSPKNLFKYLALMQSKGIEYVVLEVTAHAISQNRIYGLKFDISVFTNITDNEHLDYYKTYERYLNTKAQLLTSKYLIEGGAAVLNSDDSSFESLKKKAYLRKNINIYSYSIDKDLKEQIDQMSFPHFSVDKNLHAISGDDIKLSILGSYNIYNALAAFAVGTHLKVDKEKICKALSDFKSPLGRMNILQKEPFYAIVDFAHTPNALKQALISARSLVKPNGKLICIFGCASERDESKRPIMGKIAYDYADKIFLVPEDPRFESVESINDDIIGSLNKAKFRCFNKADSTARRDAIKTAIEEAGAGDVVISLGKGHENSMNFSGVEYPWSDIEEMKKYLRPRRLVV